MLEKMLATVTSSAAFKLNTLVPPCLEFSNTLAHKLKGLAQSEIADGCIEASAFIVGGWCRDIIMGRFSEDIDMEVFGLSTLQLKNILDRITNCKVIEPAEIGISPFKVIVARGESVDVLTPYILHKSPLTSLPEVKVAPNISMLEASKRRDFTCNSIYFEPITNTFHDPTNGIHDIKTNTLRLVPDLTAEEINSDIPLRACRMIGQLGFTLESDSRELLVEVVKSGVLKNLPTQTLKSELVKMLTRSDTPSKAFRAAEDLGILAQILPELSSLKDIPQDPRFHPEGSVFEHTMMAIDAAAKLSIGMAPKERVKVMLGTLLHDIGKLTTTKVILNNDQCINKVTSYNHETEGVMIAKKILKRLDIGSEVSKQVLKIVRYHMRPLEMEHADKNTIDSFDNHVRKLVRDIYPLSYDTFLTVCIADREGRLAQKSPSELSESVLGRIAVSIHQFGYDKDPTHRLVYGDTLKEIGFDNRSTPFQTIIGEIESKRDRGQIQTSEQGISYALYKFALSPEEITGAGINSDTLKSEFFQIYKRKILNREISSVDHAQKYLDEFKTLKRLDTDLLRSTHTSSFSSMPSPHLDFESIAKDARRSIRTTVADFVGLSANLDGIDIKFLNRLEAEQLKKSIYQGLILEALGLCTDKHLSSFLGDFNAEVDGFFSDMHRSIVIVKEKAAALIDYDLDELIFHEYAHAAQFVAKPQYYADIKSLYCEYIKQKSTHDTERVGLSTSIEKSLLARNKWREDHVTFFEDLRAQYDIDSTLPSNTKFPISTDLGRALNLQDMTRDDFIEVSNTLFNYPALVDLIYRDDRTALSIEPVTGSLKHAINAVTPQLGIHDYRIIEI